MDVEATAGQVLADLSAAGDPARAVHDRAYLKSSAEHWGVSVPGARRIVAGLGPRVERDDLLALTSRLWSSGPFDARLVAALLLERHARLLDVEDLDWMEVWLREAGTWALVDVLVPRPLAAVDAAHPARTTAALDRWINDPDFWLRRSALLAHLMPLRTSLHGWDRFTSYADMVLTDREFFVRKATGWVLRETARHDPQAVRDWVLPRAGRINPVALREALRAMPTAMQDEVRAAREGRGNPAGSIRS